ncbi:hypothetical protein IAQ61_004733 [Plenodomus lingam]|uniref:uncharacterized protein n=1 Tax=Leptosphaeria maculans TaxID=5022 RepID=UPI00331B737E|nr:hypothetical protein IAQ61_004733 [Plenodomus lingam]
MQRGPGKGATVEVGTVNLVDVGVVVVIHKATTRACAGSMTVAAAHCSVAVGPGLSRPTCTNWNGEGKARQGKARQGTDFCVTALQCLLLCWTGMRQDAPW